MILCFIAFITYSIIIYVFENKAIISNDLEFFNKLVL